MVLARRATWTTAVIALLSAARPARPCDSASCSLLTRGQSGLLSKGAVQLDLSFAYTRLGDPMDGDASVAAAVKPRVDLERQRVIPAFHSERDGSDAVFSVDAAYGLSSRVALLGSLPVWMRHSHDVAHTGVVDTFTAEGNGDALVGLRAAVGPPGLVAGFSLKLPTGTDRLGGEFGGGLLDPTLQPGTGSFDFVPSLRYARPALGLDWSMAASYQANTTSSLGYRFGDLTIATLGASRGLGGRLSASLQAKLFHQGRSRFLAAGVPSTGATFLYLTPGLRATVAHGLSVYGFVQLLGHRSVEEQQLAPSFAILAGVSKTL